MANKIQIRRDTTAHWTASDPVLSSGELGLDTTLNKIKIGNGTDNWSELSFYTGNPSTLINGSKAVTLNSTGMVTFPTVNNTQLLIEGSKLVGANNSPVAISSNSTVVINTYNPALHVWEFDNTGNLTVPGTITRPIDETLILVTSGTNERSASVSIDGEFGRLLLRTNDSVTTNTWEFSNTGGIVCPTLSVDIHNGGVQEGQVLKFNNDTKQVIITGPTPATGASAQRIIIQGQRASGRNINNQAAEGGDVYVWGGDSDYNGGDIKIYAGDADNNNVNESLGGYVNIDAGNGFTNGGNVSISAGNGRRPENSVGGNVSITAGYALNGTPGNIQLSTYAQSNNAVLSWTFGNDGKLTLPAGGDIVNNAGNSITDIYKFAGGTIGTKANPDTSNGWGGYNMYLDPGGESWASIFIPSNANQDGGASLQITNKGAATSIVQVTGWGGVQLVTNTGVDEKVFEFRDDGKLTLPKGGSVSETSNTIAFAPPTAAVGQSLVIRPTAGQFTISTDHLSGFVPGESITITVSTQFGSDSGELYYTITGATTEQLGRATTGTLTFSSESTKAVTWTIPVQSSMTTFTFDLTGGTGFTGPGGIYVNDLPEITVTLNGSASSENNHVHLVAGNPTTVDMYLGNDDQYVKIEKNAGDVVIGTNLNTHQWTFGTNGNLTLPNGGVVSETSSVIAVSLNQFTDGGYSGALVFFKTSNTLYTSSAGPTIELIASIWYLKVGVSTYYNSTDLITWSPVAGGLPAPVGTLDTIETTNLTVGSQSWTFGTNSNLTLPNASTISPVSQVGYIYGPYASDIYNNTTGGALASGTQTVINIGNTVHNDLFNPPVATATTTTGTIASNGDFEPGTSTGTFDLHTDIIVSGQSLGDLWYRDENNTAAGFTLAHPVTPYTGPVVTAGTLISGYSGWITRTPKTTTYIRWADGSSSQVTGSSVNQYLNDTYGGLITTDNVSGKSFPATLYTANYIPSGTAIGVNSNDWKFGTDGKLTLPGSTFIDTSPNYIHANHGIGLHPSHNTGGTGPELYIYYDDGIVVQPFTNDYITNNAAAPLFIRGSNLPNTNDSIGKLPGDIYINGGRNVKDNTYGKVIVNSGITSQWQFNSSGQLTFPDTTIQTTAFRDVASNVFFVDPTRTSGTYTRTGTFTSPYNSITAAFDAAVAAGFNDSFTATVILMNNTAENITLRPGVFLTSLGTGTHGSPLLAGTVTVTSSTGTTVSNHYSISNLRIAAEGNNHCINFTGTAPQKLFMRDLWLDISGTGNGIRVNNTGTGSTVHLDTGHLAHAGTGDVYCINVMNGNCYVTDIETTGTTQVAAVRSGCTLTLDSCELDANGDIVCETYGTGTLVITNSAITNTKINSTGILINDAGGTVTLGNNLITIPNGTGYAVQGPNGSFVFHANNVFTANNYRSSGIASGFIALNTSWQTKA
jgi:hypothetical protein